MTTPETEAAHWSQLTRASDVWAVDGSEWVASTDRTVERITGHLADCRNVLEIGCGIGRLTAKVAQHVERVAGCDISDAMLAKAQARCRTENVEWVLTDGRTLPPGPFDGAYSVVTFQHVPVAVQRSWFHQLGQILEPGGRFVVQLVEGTEATDWNHHVNRRQVGRWCVTAGLSAVIRTDPEFPTWLWVEGAKT